MDRALLSAIHMDETCWCEAKRDAWLWDLPTTSSNGRFATMCSGAICVSEPRAKRVVVLLNGSSQCLPPSSTAAQCAALPMEACDTAN
jgi:hypothetical protein